MRDAASRFILRRVRVRRKISGNAERPRLSVHRGLRNICAQLVDDEKGSTLVYASTLSPEIKGSLKSKDTIDAAKAVGELVSKKALEKGIKKAVFDRGGYVYMGRIKALADAARKGGLEF